MKTRFSRKLVRGIDIENCQNSIMTTEKIRYRQRTSAHAERIVGSGHFNKSSTFKKKTSSATRQVSYIYSLVSIVQRRTMNSNLSKKRSIGSVALFCVILSTVATNAFVHTMTRRPIGVKPPTQLYTSLSTPTGRNFTAFHDDDRADIKKVITKNSIKIIPIHQIDHSEMDATEDSSDFNEFHRHLKRVSFKVRNSKTRAILMDDELKRLETKFYNLTGDDMPTCRLAPSQYSYHGPTYRPDSKCYAMVINAYAKSGHGRTEACLAEEACERFEMFNPESNANSFMMKGILKAWLGVGELEKAEQCLMKMENCYKKTHQFQDAPDMMSYTLFLEALAHCRGDYESQAGSLSLELFHRMRTAYIFGENSHAMPTLRTYLAVMRCQERSYRGIIAVNKIRNVLEQLERDYEVFGRPDTCRPNAQAAMLVISIASKCRGNMQAIRIMETVLQKLQERFEESGELEYRPLDQMYTLLFSAYSKVNAENAPTCSKKVDKFLAMMQKNEMTPSIYATTAGMYPSTNKFH